MPFFDPPPPGRSRPARRGHFGFAHQILRWIEARKRRRRGRRDLEDGGVPVEPNKPKNLSGGAAAALEFEADGDV